jgi:hypothetical protein
VSEHWSQRRQITVAAVTRGGCPSTLPRRFRHAVRPPLARTGQR